MCCKKKLLELHFEKKSLYSTYSIFLVINVCNQENTLCSPCISNGMNGILGINTSSLAKPVNATTNEVNE